MVLPLLNHPQSGKYFFSPLPMFIFIFIFSLIGCAPANPSRRNVLAQGPKHLQTVRVGITLSNLCSERVVISEVYILRDGKRIIEFYQPVTYGQEIFLGSMRVRGGDCNFKLKMRIVKGEIVEKDYSMGGLPMGADLNLNYLNKGGGGCEVEVEIEKRGGKLQKCIENVPQPGC